MKDLEIFIDDSILPDIENNLNPPEEAQEEAEEGEAGAEEEKKDE